MPTVKTVFTLTFFSFFTLFTTLAQSKLDVKVDRWETLSENNKGKVEFRRTLCDNNPNGINREVVQIRLSNKTKAPIQISYDMSMVYEKYTLNGLGNMDELKYTIELAPKQIIEPVCYERRTSQIIQIRLLDIPSKELLDFNLLNLTIQ